MGRKSQDKRKEKRKVQKHNKKTQKRLQRTCTNALLLPSLDNAHPTLITNQSQPGPNSPREEAELPESFGSPGSPPSSESLDNILGIDSDALGAELDLKYGFEKPELEEKLEGEQLTSYLKECNSKLASKVRHYRNQCEILQLELQEREQKCNDSVDRIRHFYRDLMFYGTSQGALMLKASYKNTSSR